MKCTLFLSIKYDASALHHLSKNTFMHVALHANPETLLFHQITEKIHLYSYTRFVHFPSKFYRKTKQNISIASRQNILTYQNDAFQFVSPKPKLHTVMETEEKAAFSILLPIKLEK